MTKHGPLRVGIGGPVGVGKTTLTEQLCRALAHRCSMAVITNDIYTREDADYLTRAQEELPDKSAIAFSLATAYIGQGRRDEGRRVVESALVQFPDEAALHDLLGQLHQRSGRPDGMKDARISFSRAIAINPNVGSYQERYGVAKEDAEQQMKDIKSGARNNGQTAAMKGVMAGAVITQPQNMRGSSFSTCSG